MRVISGSARGTRLGAVPKGVRPVSDRAREGLFSSLEASGGVNGLHVLDLFAGTGALGIEALSRGASHAIFVDRSAAALAALRGNLDRTHLADSATVVRAEATAFLTRKGNAAPASIAFVDPPYGAPPGEIEAVLRALSRGWLVQRDWIVVLTRPRRSSNLVIPVDWVVARRLDYGDSRVICYREE
jgi:16S rRNA (guanine966-N2)-methyltransferase